MEHVKLCILSIGIIMVTASGSMAGEWEPFYTHWVRAGLPKGSSAVTGIEWADQQLGLGTFDSLGNGLVVGPGDSVSPYEHLEGRMSLVSRSGMVDSQWIVFREVREKDEYLKRLSDVEIEFDGMSRQPGSILTKDGSPERRIIHYERNWMDKERTFIIKEENGVKFKLSKVVRDELGNVRMVPHTKSETTYIRYEDKLLLQGRVPEVFEIPRDAFIRRRRFSDDDSTWFLNVADISDAMREAIWTGISGGSSVGLQQYDNEADATYAARRLLGENRIELLRSAFFDIDSAWVSMKCSTASEPFHWSSSIDVKAETDLSAGLASFGRTSSKLQPLDSDHEFAGLHWCSRIPPTLSEFLIAATKLLEARTGRSEIAEILGKSVQEGDFEVQLSLQAVPEHGVVGIGNMRISNDSDEAQEWLRATLASFDELQAQLVVGSNGCTFQRILLPDLEFEPHSLLSRFGFVKLPKFVFLHIRDKVLWFTFGREDAWKVLDAELNKATDEDREVAAAGRYLFICRMDLASATWNNEEASPLATFLEELERTYAEWSAKRISTGLSSAGFVTRGSVPTSFKSVLKQALNGRPAQANLVVSSDASGISAELTADESLVLAYYGRMALAMMEAMEVSGGLPGRKTQTLQDVLPKFPQGQLPN